MNPHEPVEPDFEALIRFIQENRGVDFRGYKKTSLRRRVLRRMEELQCDGFSSYHAFLEAHPQEFVDLLNTVLINVTSFFRDTEAWDVVRDEVIPRILARRGPGGQVRVWSVGCASGEEPYSLAMLLAEALGPEIFCSRVKIYATDLDEEALNTARHATYASKDVESVPPEYLKKYFERTNNHYVFQRELRKCVIFGRHNIVHDAPISRIDLLVCRNLLIYLETDTQNLVLPRMHYALANDGVLFLGKAETQLARSKLFEPINLKHRIFRKVPQEWRRSLGGSAGLVAEPHPSRPTSLQGRLLEAIVDGSPQAYLAVGADGNLAFANVAARRLLEVGEGDIGRPFQDLAVSYRPAELRSRIEEVERTGRPLRLEHQEFHRPPADPVRLTIEVMPLGTRDGKPYATLLSFTDSTRLFKMQQELEAAQESLETIIEELQSANEELETTNEELQSTNEELETTNEELQSTNEELETMNEELRSTNEELEVANEELRRHSDDTAEYRNYTESILRSIDLGIIVLDMDLTVQSWNRWCENAWGLRGEEVTGATFLNLDIGLPTHRLRDALDAALGGRGQEGIRLDAIDRRGRSISCDVRAMPLLYEGRLPRGVVLIIEDTTEAARQEECNRYIGRVVGQSLDQVLILDPATLRIQLTNKGVEAKLGYSLPQLRQLTLHDLLPGMPRMALDEVVAPLLSKERPEQVVRAALQSRDGRSQPVEIRLQHADGEEPPILVAIIHDSPGPDGLPAG